MNIKELLLEINKKKKRKKKMRYSGGVIRPAMLSTISSTHTDTGPTNIASGGPGMMGTGVVGTGGAPVGP